MEFVPLQICKSLIFTVINYLISNSFIYQWPFPSHTAITLHTSSFTIAFYQKKEVWPHPIFQPILCFKPISFLLSVRQRYLSSSPGIIIPLTSKHITFLFHQITPPTQIFNLISALLSPPKYNRCSTFLSLKKKNSVSQIYVSLLLSLFLQSKFSKSGLYIYSLYSHLSSTLQLTVIWFLLNNKVQQKLFYLYFTKSLQVLQCKPFLKIYLFLAALGLHCCARAFSSCGEWGLLLVAVRGLLIAVASLVAEHRL